MPAERDAAYIANFSMDSNLHVTDYWSDDSSEALRADIKAHYIREQGTRCCYCNRHLGTVNHKDWDTEHVVARSTHARFMYEPLNLAVACHDCNTAKGSRCSLKNNRRKTYPKSSSGFLIVHPHFDEYDEHILVLGHLYIPMSDKGVKTIYMCNLLRFTQRFIGWNQPIADDRFEAEVRALSRSDEFSVNALLVLRETLKSLNY